MRDNYAYYASLPLRTRILNVARGIFRLPVLERWLMRRTQGALPGSRIARMIPHEYGYAKNSWREVERNGFKYRLDLSNAVDHYLYFGLAEPGYENLFAHIDPDAHIVDVGANIGMLTMPFARAAWAGRVVSFEPDPKNRKRLLEQLAMNAIGNVQVMDVGLGREAATHRLYQVVDTNSGMNRIVLGEEQSERFPYHEIRVEVMDAIWPTLSLEKLDVMKVDVEGFEYEVLKGAEATLRKFKPVLFIELDDDNLRENGSSALELIGYLGTLGYSARQAVDLSSLPRDLAHCHMDVLCTA